MIFLIFRPKYGTMYVVHARTKELRYDHEAQRAQSLSTYSTHIFSWQADLDHSVVVSTAGPDIQTELNYYKMHT